MREWEIFFTSFLHILQKSFKLETTGFQEIIAIIVCNYILIKHQYKKANYHDK